LLLFLYESGCYSIEKHMTMLYTIWYRKRKGGIRLDDKTADTNNDEPHTEDNYNKQLEIQLQVENLEKKEENEKKKADNLWADFMNDVGPTKPKPKSSTNLDALSSTSKVCLSKHHWQNMISLSNRIFEHILPGHWTFIMWTFNYNIL
jgi:hypothetical protein